MPAAQYINMALFFANPGQGSQWHTHPQETEEEEFLYILQGKGTMYYKQGGKDHAMELKEGEAIFTGHLTHYVKNTGTGPLSIYFSIAPLPAKTIIYGVKNDKGLGFVDSVNLKPPQLVRHEDIEMTGFAKGSWSTGVCLPQRVSTLNMDDMESPWRSQARGRPGTPIPRRSGKRTFSISTRGKA